jgi:hypothetical protein
MRMIAIAAAVLATVAFCTSVADAAPWCAQYGGRGNGGTNCGFYSFQQCMAAVSGTGGFCTQNYAQTSGSKPRKRYRRSN